MGGFAGVVGRHWVHCYVLGVAGAGGERVGGVVLGSATVDVFEDGLRLGVDHRCHELGMQGWMAELGGDAVRDAFGLGDIATEFEVFRVA